MNEDNIREKTDLELEREELNLLVKQGVRFSVTHKIRRRKKGVKGFFQRPEAVTVKEDFEIQEPTLSILDRLSAVWVEMGIDETRITAGGTETLAEAKRIAKDNAARMARIIAIAVLGEDYHVTEVSEGGRVKTSPARRRISAQSASEARRIESITAQQALNERRPAKSRP